MEEIHKLLALVMDFYTSLGFKPRFYLATRPDKAMGDPEMWKMAERNLEEALKQTKVTYEIKEKDGAFYGPKIDSHIEDSQGRDWQLATIQLDFMMPERLELEYIDSKGQQVRPVMIHRGIFGSVERFIGMLIEHFQGAFPLWLAPVQIAIIPIAERHNAAAQEVAAKLKDAGIRVEVDDRNERMQAKIRDLTLQKVPYLGIIGNKEVDNQTISVRTRSGQDLMAMSIEDLVRKLKDEIESKA
jgi:threonyl-tRNA synthetase